MSTVSFQGGGVEQWGDEDGHLSHVYVNGWHWVGIHMLRTSSSQRLPQSIGH